MGASGHGGGSYGDLQIEITVRPHPLFTRKENDIYLELPITFGEAALGAKIEIPTMEGGTVMTLPPGTQSGQKFKLSGKGFLSSKTGRKGDQFVTIKVAVPKNLSEREKALIQDLEALYKEPPRKGMKRK
jgi:DnaJ-class molecular chaperone